MAVRCLKRKDPSRIFLCANYFACVFVILFAANTINASAPDASRLMSYAGSYDINALLNESEVQSKLQQIAGDDLPLLLTNLSVTGPIDLIGNWLSIAGNAPHEGTVSEAVVCINITGTVVHAAILSVPDINILSRETNYVNLPLCIKDWITLVESGHRNRLKQPAFVLITSLGNPETEP